jgi:hypothetical protein
VTANSVGGSGCRVRSFYRSGFVGCEEKSQHGEQESMIRKRVIAMILAVLVIALEAMAKATRALTWLH